MMIFKILISFLLLSTFLYGAIKEVEVSGNGFTKQEAIYNALIEAVRQINGTEIASKTKTSFSHEEMSSNINNNSKDASLSSSSVKKDIAADTKGAVEKYEILESSNNGNEWDVRLLVSVPVYKAPGVSNNNRRSIAVMPFYATQNSFSIGSKKYSAEYISDMISQAITTNITQSRKFSVADKTYTKDMAKELNLISSQEVPLAQRVKLGQKLGADYLLVGTIKKADMQTNHTKNSSTGESGSETFAEFIIDYRIIVVGSSQIKWSDTTKAVIDMSNSKSSVEMALQNAVERVSTGITNSLLSNIYPVRIVQITNSGDIVINQGGNSIEKGMRLDVMKPGEKIIDPYTKESLGTSESKIAQIEITRVTAKLSYAKIVDGTLSMLSKNDICRRQGSSMLGEKVAEVDNENWRQTNVEVSNGGGVKLPFD